MRARRTVAAELRHHSCSPRYLLLVVVRSRMLVRGTTLDYWKRRKPASRTVVGCNVRHHRKDQVQHETEGCIVSQGRQLDTQGLHLDCDQARQTQTRQGQHRTVRILRHDLPLVEAFHTSAHYCTGERVRAVGLHMQGVHAGHLGARLVALDFHTEVQKIALQGPLRVAQMGTYFLDTR